MIVMTYDPEADAMYITLSRGKVARTEETGPFLYDVNADGRLLGIEILSCKTVLAPGGWSEAPRPSVARAEAAE